MTFKFVVPKARYSEIDGKKIRPCRRKSTLGKPDRRILVDKTVNGIEFKYHATKGWRCVRTSV